MDLFVYYSIFSHPPRIRRPPFLRFFFNMACWREEFWWSSGRGWVPGQELQNSIFPKQAWIFSLSLLGLAPLAERVSFLSEQIACYAGPTVGGLLNATCGNAPELIIALLALHRDKLEILKWSLLGSILSNLLLVLGSSLFFGGLANLNKERPFDRKQADVSLNLLLLASLCYSLVFILPFAVAHGKYKMGSVSVLELSRLCSIIMLIAYFGCLFFQLRTNRQLFETQE